MVKKAVTLQVGWWGNTSVGYLCTLTHGTNGGVNGAGLVPVTSGSAQGLFPTNKTRWR